MGALWQLAKILRSIGVCSGLGFLYKQMVERFQGFSKRWRVDQAFGSAIVGDFTMSGACSFVTHVQGV